MSIETRNLSEIAKLASGGTPSKSNPAFWGGDIPWLTPKDMASFDGSTQDYVSPNAIGKGTKLAPANAIFIAVRGMSLHNEIRIVRPQKEMAFNQDIKSIVPTDAVDDTFLFYALKHRVSNLLSQVHAAGHGTGVLATELINNTPIPVFSKSEQLAIGSALADFDDKIKLNRRMNETLEEMARALFRDWFVDFGPTRSQMEGATDPAAIMGQAFPPEKAATLAPLFPAKLGDDGLPEGWETQRIEHALDRLKVGKLYNQKTALNEGKVPILDQGKFGVIGYHNNEPNIVASVEHRVGIFANHTCVQRLLDHPFSTIQNVIPYRGKELPTEWCHYATLGQQAFEEYKGHWPTFVSKEIIKPKPEPAIAFSEFVDAMLLKASANEQENQTLADMRDLLLPKLMSGEIRLKVAEAVS